MKILWLVVAICSAFGILTGLIPALTLAKSAPQEAALAAIGIAWAVIPYCFVKAISMMKPRSVIVKTNKD